MLPPPGIFVGISPVDATCGDAMVNYRFAGREKKAREGVQIFSEGNYRREYCGCR